MTQPSLHAVAADPTLFDPEEIGALARRAMQAGRLEDALRLVKAGLVQAQEDGALVYLLATVHAQLGLSRRALAELARAVVLAPALVPAHFQHGLLLYGQDRHTEAAVAWQPLQQLLPAQDPMRLFADGLGRLAQGDPAAAIGLLEQGIATCRNEGLNEDMRGMVAQARLRLQAGPSPAAAGLEPEPDTPSHLLLSGYARSRSGLN